MSENKAIVLSFDILMSKVMHSHSAVRSRERELCQAKTELFEKIREYNRKRLEIFEAQLRINKVLWCTWCKQMFPEDQFELVLIVERETESCGYEGGDYTFRTNERLHRVCPTCKIKAYEKHGWYGPYNHTAHDQASYSAHKIEFRDGEYYRGHKKLEEKLPEMPQELFDQLSKEWGIPAKLGFNNQGDLIHIESRKEIFVS